MHKKNPAKIVISVTTKALSRALRNFYLANFDNWNSNFLCSTQCVQSLGVEGASEKVLGGSPALWDWSLEFPAHVKSRSWLAASTDRRWGVGMSVCRFLLPISPAAPLTVPWGFYPHPSLKGSGSSRRTPWDTWGGHGVALLSLPQRYQEAYLIFQDSFDKREAGY